MHFPPASSRNSNSGLPNVAPAARANMDLRRAQASTARLRVKANIKGRLPDRVGRRVPIRVLRRDRKAAPDRTASNFRLNVNVAAAAEKSAAADSFSGAMALEFPQGARSIRVNPKGK